MDRYQRRRVFGLGAIGVAVFSLLMLTAGEAETPQVVQRRTVAMLGVVVAAFAVGLVVMATAFLWPSVGIGGSVTVSARSLEESQYGVIYLEDRNVFVVATDDGPIALLDDAQNAAGDRVRYCPLRDYFEGPRFGGKFDRLGRYAAGPARRDMDRVTLEVTNGEILLRVDEIVESSGRSPFADPPKGPHCAGLSDDPGFFLPQPFE